MSIQTITLGAGCFWCLENILAQLNGVESAISGYADGNNEDPTYEQVCTGKTDHAEVVQLTFNTDILSIETLLTVFFAVHDPTTLNRQGNDIGSQYRSTILYHNKQQQQLAQQKIAQLNATKQFADPIVTILKPITDFYAAEDYHQDYFNNNPSNQYCQLVVAKKIQKFHKDFKHLLK